MKKIIDCKILGNRRFSDEYSLLTLTPKDGSPLPKIHSGQFVQVAVPNSKNTFLRRPISVCIVIDSRNAFTMMIRNAGEGTKHLIQMETGQILNVILPLGNGWKVDKNIKKPLLIGGGVGQAPLGQLANEFYQMKVRPQFLLGARSKKEHIMEPLFSFFGDIAKTTDDGSVGFHGLVTQHPIMQNDLKEYDMVYCCGPTPMMKAVAKICKEVGVPCQVSLENEMACGLGACLCCVQDTKEKGNVCVCTDGPVFDINDLNW